MPAALGRHSVEREPLLDSLSAMEAIRSKESAVRHHHYSIDCLRSVRSLHCNRGGFLLQDGSPFWASSCAMLPSLLSIDVGRRRGHQVHGGGVSCGLILTSHTPSDIRDPEERRRRSCSARGGMDGSGETGVKGGKDGSGP